MSGARPRLLILVSEERVFWSHRRPMAEAARAAGFEVSVATHLADDGSALRAEGWRPLALKWRRSARGPVATLRAVLELAALYRRERPDIAHHFSVQAIVVGGLAARLARAPRVIASFTGLGTAFLAEGRKAALRRWLIVRLLRLVLRPPGRTVIVQNRDDAAIMQAHGLAAVDAITLIPGSGVDDERFRPLDPAAAPPVVFAYVGRLIRDKGLDALIAAARRLRGRVDMRLLLVGDRDEANDGGYSAETVRGWEEEGVCVWRGPVSDVRAIWAEAHVAVLPSRREGMPLSLLEAAACGRPLLAADAPGSRDLVEPFTNGLLHPIDDDAALADAMALLASDPGLRARLGAAARAKVERDHSAAVVGAAAVALYRALSPVPLADIPADGHVGRE